MNVFSADEKPGQPLSAPGAQLAARRQALDWSIEYVANQLNLAPRQIQAIETDNFAALPGMACARGFIRSYAKLVKIDPAPLLLAIANETTGSDELMPLRRAMSAIPFSESRLSSASPRLPAKLVFIGLIAVLVTAALLIGHKTGWFSVLPESLSSKIDGEFPFLSAPGPVGSAKTADASRVGTDVAAAGSLAAPAMAEFASVNSMASGAPAINTAVPAGLPGIAADTTLSSASAAVIDTKDLLVLTLRADSWIEIKGQGGGTSVSRLAKAGETETYKLTAPVSLTIGNASGVDATLRGMPIALQADAKNNVARLNLK